VLLRLGARNFFGLEEFSAVSEKNKPYASIGSSQLLSGLRKSRETEVRFWRPTLVGRSGRLEGERQQVSGKVHLRTLSAVLLHYYSWRVSGSHGEEFAPSCGLSAL